MSILCIDYGSKTLGIAVSDDLGMMGHGIGTIRRSTKALDFAELRKHIQNYEVEKIVLGLPCNMDGSIGPAAQAVLGFGEELKAEFGLPVETWDERLSTFEAEDRLIGADMRSKKRRKVIDTVAAAIILQGYLDHKKQQEPQQS
jgi:putative holliday junction resolvase